MVVLPGKRRVFGYLIAAALLCGGPEIAQAKKYRVRIDSRPRGATVLLGNGKELGTTPVNTRIDGGEHVIIVRKAGYVETVETISVGRRGRNRFKLDLERAEMGKIKVVAKIRALNRADIYVDGKKVGTVPKTISVAAGARQVEVKKAGYTNFDEWVEVSAGDRVVVRAFAKRAASTPAVKPVSGDGDGDGDADDDDDDDDDIISGDDDDDDDDVGGDGDGDGDGDGEGDKVADNSNTTAANSTPDNDKIDVSKSARPNERAPGSFLVLRGGVDFGGRTFRYQQPMTNNLRPYDAFPFPVGRLTAEVYPLGLFTTGLGAGLGFTADVGLGFPLNSETKGDMPAAIATTWMDWSIGARFRFPLSSSLRFAAAGTYGKRSFNFDDEGSMVAGEVPDIDYNEVGLGADLEIDATKTVTLVLAGRYLLLSGFGELGERFNVTSASGLGGSVRLDIGLSDRFDLVLRGFFQRATLSLEVADAAFNASGGTDQYLGALVGLGVNL